MKIKLLVALVLLVLAYDAKAECVGDYVNKDGGVLSVPKSKDKKLTVQMSYAGKNAPCKGEYTGDSTLQLTCFTGSVSGSFSADCKTLTYSGLTWTKK